MMSPRSRFYLAICVAALASFAGYLLDMALIMRALEGTPATLSAGHESEMLAGFMMQPVGALFHRLIQLFLCAILPGYLAAQICKERPVLAGTLSVLCALTVRIMVVAAFTSAPALGHIVTELPTLCMAALTAAMVSAVRS